MCAWYTHLISSITQPWVFSRHIRNQNRQLSKMGKMENPSDKRND